MNAGLAAACLLALDGRRVALVAGLALGLSGAGLPQLAAAQSRVELPDFTELVEQVGPSVVNIRTLERVSSRPRQGGGSEEGRTHGISPETEQDGPRLARRSPRVR